MKKTLLLIFAMILVCASLLAGCSKPVAADTSAEVTTSATAAKSTAAPSEPVSSASASESAGVGVTVTDMLDREVSIGTADKIVSIAPSTTETLYALGVGDRIVGVDAYSTYPEEAAAKEIVGDYNGPDVEKIVALEPDIVFCGNTLQQEQIDTMEKMGLTVVATEASAFEDITKSIELVGAAVGKDAEAKAIAESIESAAANAKAGASKEEKTVYFVMSFGDMGNWTSGPGSFINSMIETAGGVPVTRDAADSWLEYPVEDLVAADPDIILLSSMAGTLDDLKAANGYADLTAVKNGKVYVVDADVISRPGPRIAEAISTISDIVNK